MKNKPSDNKGQGQSGLSRPKQQVADMGEDRGQSFAQIDDASDEDRGQSFAQIDDVKNK